DPRPAPRERAIPPPDELEPAVDTTRGAGAPTPAASAPAAPAAPAAAAPGAPAAPAAPPARAPRAGAPSRDETAGAGGPPREAGAVAGAKGAAAAGAKGAAAATKTGARKGPDRLELDTTDITGNRVRMRAGSQLFGLMSFRFRRLRLAWRSTGAGVSDEHLG